MNHRSNQLCRRSRGKPGGFTLVELLVVIGIIALLISILLPALSRAKDSANTLKCLANLRSIGQAVTQYANDTKGFMVPCAWDVTVSPPAAAGPNAVINWWPNILVDGGYLQAPDSSKGSMGYLGTVLACPAGVTELPSQDLANNATIPTTRRDLRGAMPYRYWSVNGTSVDCWYGMNAAEGTSTTTGHPGRRIPVGTTDGLFSMSVYQRPAQMVMFFDGMIYHLDLNGNRLNARHAKQTKTNLVFFDGHAETVNTADLPGGMGLSGGAATGAAFALAQLQTSALPNVLWLLDQLQ